MRQTDGAPAQIACGEQRALFARPTILHARGISVTPETRHRAAL
jgi:hypothetical protein